MTATPILEALAREFSARPEHVQSALEMLDAGLCAPFIGRFRRAQVGLLSESAIRRLDRRRKEFEELDRRRATILSMLERDPSSDPSIVGLVRSCMDRFELEDLFIPHRRPEPEVQLALDRGLGALADRLVAPLSLEERAALGMLEEPAPEEPAEGEAPAAPAEASSAEATLSETPATEPAPASETAEAVAVAVAEAPAEPAPEPSAESAPAPSADASAESASDDDEVEEAPAPPAPIHAIDVKTAMNVHVARLCAPFVNPDRGVHTETEALAGAVRILSDRLGRNPRLRGAVRRLLAKQGVLTVRPTVDEGRLGRHKALVRLKAPLRQVQGHRLLAIRQAQKERLLHTVITLDPAIALPKVRAALGRHTHPAHEPLLREIALQALNQRLVPMVEPDVRLELKERADFEALRFLAQHLRQLLYAPPLGPFPVAGIDVNAKGDWTIASVDGDGEPIGAEVKIEVGGKEPAALGQELRAILEPLDLRAIVIGHGKGARAALPKIRAALRAARLGILPTPVAPTPAAPAPASDATAPDSTATDAAAPPQPAPVQPAPVHAAPPPPAPASSSRPWNDPFVYLTSEAGLSSYANSELGRSELPDRSIAARMAISLARRLQDPMAEFLKVDPRHLGLGSEQGLVSKANARRVFVETIESAAAHVGCNVNRAPVAFLEIVPGLSRAIARKIVERRKQSPLANREDLRSEGLLSEAQWTSAVAFLRVQGSSEPLDGTALHPEQYPLVRRVLDSAGSSVDQALGRFGATRGLRREDFDVDEPTWRDMMREIAWPGRDPRHRLHAPALLDPDTDPVRLVKDRVVEGVVSNVASFGVFVDVGLANDAMVHISEISDRYVRDARELLSVGQIVRARIVDAGGQRLTLSLRNVPAEPRAPRPERGPRTDRGGFPGRGDGPRPGGGGGGGGGRGGFRGRGGRDRRGPEEDRSSGPPPNVRAAQSRRDGLGVGGGRRGDRKGRGGPRDGGGGGGRPGPGGGGGGRPGGYSGGRDGRGPRDAEFGRDERASLESLNRSKAAFSPFATFFNKAKKPEGSGETDSPESSGEQDGSS